MPRPPAVYNRRMTALESGRYHRLQLLLGLARLVLGAAFLAAVLLLGGGRILADPTLRTRLLALAERAGVSAVGVWIADQSRKSRTANAAVIGLGRTRRILLYDTLAAGFRPEEIEAVLAHELGHHAHGDLRRGLLVQGALSVATFWIASHALRAGVGRFGYASVADPAGLPWLALVLAALGLVLTPLVNAFSRYLERQADDFALALTRDPAGFIGAMERLAALNLA